MKPSHAPKAPMVIDLDSPTDRQREQNRNRQRRHRQQKKAKAAAAPAQQPTLYTGITTSFKRLPQYSLENVRWMLAVGTFPSAGGARAPLSSILSHVAIEVSRWTVERYRWRAVRYMMAKQDELHVDFLRARAVGVVLRFDETPMRLFVNGENCASVATMVRCVTAFDPNGFEFTLAPVLRQLSNQKAEGLLGALQLEDLKLGEMCGFDQRWRFLLVVTDGAAVNRSVARCIVAELERYPRVVVAFNVCSTHTLSNATKKALAEFPYGSYLRLCHVLQARGVKNVETHCARMLTVPDPAIAAAPWRGDVEVTTLWSQFAKYVMGACGPCADSSNRQLALDVAARAACLFPSGPPRADRMWLNCSAAPASEYASVVQDMFRRTAPVPVLTRWYTVERTAWYFVGMRTFSLFSHVMSADMAMRYWPGDAADVVFADPAAYAVKSSARTRRVCAFSQSPEFVCSVLVCAISSIPRWDYADALNAAATTPCSPRGVTAAQKAFLDSTWRIVKGKDALAEFLLAGEAEQGNIRLSTYMALARAAAYLSLKNLPYSSALWKMIRGETDISNLSENLAVAPCCASSGLECKIAQTLGALSGNAVDVAAQSLEVALRALSNAYTCRGGAENVESERMFSLCRALGLKLPYRPLRPSTMQRELTLRFFLIEHRRWFSRLVDEVYGSMQNMRSTTQRRPTKYNGFTAFLQSTHGFAADYDHIWAKLSDELKNKWAAIAKEMTAADVADRSALEAAVAGPGSKGPLESIDRKCPIDVADVFQRLHDPDSRLRDIWKHDAVREWTRGLDRAADPRVRSLEERESCARVLLPGDKCAWCRCVRIAALERFANLRKVIRAEFSSRNGVAVGLTVGLLLDDDISWFEVVSIVEKPEHFLAFPLAVVRERVGLFDDIGYRRYPIEARLEIGDVFDGRTLSLIDLLVSNESLNAHAAFFCNKLGAIVGPDGWSVLYALGCDARLIKCNPVDLMAETDDARADENMPGSPQNRNGSRKRNRGNSTAMGTQEYWSIFGGAPETVVPDTARENPAPSVIDLDTESAYSDATAVAESVWVEDEDSEDAAPPGLPADSDEELAELIRATTDDRRDISAKVRLVIDQTNYSVSTSDVKGTVTCFWKASEKNANRIRRRRAQAEIRKRPGAKHLHASNSSLLSKYGMDDCVRRAQLWHEWHRAWLYDIRPGQQLPRSMPLPSGMAGRVVEAVRRRRGGSRGSSSGSSCAGSESSSAAVEVVSECSTSDMESTSEGTEVGT